MDIMKVYKNLNTNEIIIQPTLAPKSAVVTIIDKKPTIGQNSPMG